MQVRAAAACPYTRAGRGSDAHGHCAIYEASVGEQTDSITKEALVEGDNVTIIIKSSDMLIGK